jgi:phosphonate transport system substrate-binding protein
VGGGGPRPTIGGRRARYPTAAGLLVAMEQACPPRLDEVSRYKAWIQERVATASFAAQHGRLPDTGISSSFPLGRITPVLESEADFTVNLKPARALRFGVSPALGAKMARRRSEQLLALLGGRLHRELRTVVVADYEGLVEGLIAGELDLAWMPPVPFIQAADRGAGALLVALRQGRPSYDAALIVRADSKIDSIAGLRGGSIAWLDADSASGYVFPAAEIARQLGPPDQIFTAQHFHGSHQAVCEAVLNGWDSAGATYATRDDAGRVVSSGWLDVLGDRASEIRAIAFCGPIPGDNIAHRPDLPRPLIVELTRILAGMQADREGRELLQDVFNADGLAPVTLDVYDIVRETVRLVRSGS